MVVHFPRSERHRLLDCAAVPHYATDAERRKQWEPLITIAAKGLLYGTADVGLPAGPSESITLADESDKLQLLARDLLIEGEHGPDSSSLLVTNSRSLTLAVMGLLPRKMAALPDWRQDFVRTVFEAPKEQKALCEP
jgi:histidinol dehydrogenase